MKIRDLKHRTHIVVTLGPATESPARLKALLALGVDIARANMSHGSAEEHLRRIQAVRRIARKMRKKISILVDLPGPKFRLGKLPTGSLILRAGQTVQLAPSNSPFCRGECIPLRQPDILSRLKKHHVIFINDGLVALVVLRVLKGIASCRVRAGGVIRSGSGINLPHTNLGMVLPTEADRRWIRFAASQKAEWLAASFVQTPEDIRRIRQTAFTFRYYPRVMAKIEKRQALKNLKAIIRESDGVMVARGDLGVETPLEEIPFAQKRIIAEANRQKKFVVTATQMLESMVAQPSPTRAEVTDIANAVIDGTDAVMLSAETAIGKYPLEAVSALSRVLYAAEKGS